MAYREYIGSRYVPIFGRKGETTTEWDNLAPYEPLTVVTHEGNSYISRQYVPTGIDIDNREYWVESGNYNAQIEAYRQEVLGFDERITENTADIDKINSELHVNVMNGDFTATLVSDENNDFLIDCSGYTSQYGSGDRAKLDNFLSRNLGSKKLKAFIVTHFHNDHAKYPDVVAQYCDASTDIYCQMPVTVNDVGETEYREYLENYELLVNTCQSKGLKQPVTPSDFSTVKYDNMVLTFYNTNPANKASYRNSIANNGAEHSTGRQTLNNYSLITRFDNGASSYVDTGDVESAAEELYAGFMQPSNVAKIPHHFFNRIGIEKFFDNLNPDYWLATDHFNDVIGDISLNAYRYSYIYRYLMFNQDTTNIITNVDDDVKIDVKMGTVTNVIGFYVDKDHDVDGIIGINGIQSLLPPIFNGLDNDGDPYWLEKLQISDLWKIKRGMDGQFFPDFTINPPTTAPVIGNTIIRKQLDFLYLPYNSESNVINLNFQDEPKAIIHGSNLAGNIIELNANVQNAVFGKIDPNLDNIEKYMAGSNESWRYNANTSYSGFNYTARFSYGAQRCDETHGGIARGEYKNGDKITNNSLRNGTILAALISTGAVVPLVRASAIGQKNLAGTTTYSVNTAIFQGSALTGNGDKIYHVAIMSDGTLQVTLTTIADGTVDTDENVYVVDVTRIL